MSYKAGDTVRFMRHYLNGGTSIHTGEILNYKPGATRPYIRFTNGLGKKQEIFVNVEDILEYVDLPFEPPAEVIVQRLRWELADFSVNPIHEQLISEPEHTIKL